MLAPLKLRRDWRRFRTWVLRWRSALDDDFETQSGGEHNKVVRAIVGELSLGINVSALSCAHKSDPIDSTENLSFSLLATRGRTQIIAAS